MINTASSLHRGRAAANALNDCGRVVPSFDAHTGDRSESGLLIEMKDKDNVTKGILIKKKILKTKNNEMKLHKKSLFAGALPEKANFSALTAALQG